MRRRVSVFIALIGVVGLLGLNPAAQANHDGGPRDDKKKDVGKHEGMPTPPDPNENVLAVCAVGGRVSIGNSQSQNATGGVDVTGSNHNHYRFEDTLITCPVAPNPAFAGAFSVDAAGGTDGPASQNPINTHHGENAAAGWSHSDCYAGRCTSWWGNKKVQFTDLYDGVNTNDGNQCTNCGEISIDGAATDSQSTSNWVKFSRVGNHVVAWGALHATAGGGGVPIACFLADLNFTPFNEANPTKPKVDGALLDGTAVVWNANNNKANCARDKGQKD